MKNMNFLKHLHEIKVETKIDGSNVIFKNLDQKKNFSIPKKDLGIHLKQNMNKDEFSKKAKVLIESLIKKNNDPNSKWVISLLKNKV